MASAAAVVPGGYFESRQRAPRTRNDMKERQHMSRNLFFAATLSAALLFAACDDDDDNGGSPTPIPQPDSSDTGTDSVPLGPAATRLLNVNPHEGGTGIGTGPSRSRRDRASRTIPMIVVSG